MGGPSELSVDFPEVYRQVYPYQLRNAGYTQEARVKDYGDYQSHPLWHKLLCLHEDNLKAKYEKLKGVGKLTTGSNWRVSPHDASRM